MSNKIENDLKLNIIKILKNDGVAEQTAKNIAYGTQKMNILDRAIRLSKYPNFLSPHIWEFLYKGRNRV